MKNSEKTKEQLLNKINELQTKIIELEKTKNDQKEIQKELRLKNTAFESSIAANSISDINGIIVNANPAFIDIWGYDSMKEVAGKPIPHFFKNKDEALKIVTALDETGKWEGVYDGLKKDGSIFNAYGLATIVQDEKGNNIGYYSAVIDVSEQRKTEENLVKRNEELELFSNLTIGREMKMIELKKEVNNLLEEAGKEPTYEIVE